VVDRDHEQLVDRYQRLLDISRDLSSTLDLNALLNRIVHAAADLCYAEAASILMYNHSRQELDFQASSNFGEPFLPGLIIPVEGSLAGIVVKERKPINIADVRNDPHHYRFLQESTGIEIDSLLAVPLISKNNVIGVLEVINNNVGQFTDADQNLLMALGSQAAVAIENSLLFQQSDLISEFIHELRTPLVSLNAASHLLLRDQVSEEQKGNIVQTIQNETSRLTRMASHFLDLSQLESGRVQFQIELFDLKALLEECAAIVSGKIEENNQKLDITIEEHLPHIKADRDKIKQVFLNLLNNAYKYGGEGNTIRLDARHEAGEIIVRVEDNGPGIPPEYLPYVFEKFYRVPNSSNVARGSGLGLSICKRIIDA